MNVSNKRRVARTHRKRTVRRKIVGTDARPRVSVFRSNRYIYVQVISDETGRTLVSGSTLKGGASAVTVGAAAELGKQIAEQCKTQSITNVVFDRNGYRYHGRVKALADAAREAGLNF
ncbi:MAG: large subunit ribosomal protein L18 [Hyphomicrobiaceae bacterium]|jgi:large subunit ribosomal protein L18